MMKMVSNLEHTVLGAAFVAELETLLASIGEVGPGTILGAADGVECGVSSC